MQIASAGATAAANYYRYVHYSFFTHVDCSSPVKGEEVLNESTSMLHAALLAVVLATHAGAPKSTHNSAITQCFETMDGAVYHGDPSDRTLMKANVAACGRGIAAIARIRPPAAQGPEKLFLSGRLLDRAATLSYIGLNDARTALPEVRTANLYFRVAAGLTDQTPEYRAAALANVQLTALQLHTLRAEIAARPHAPAVVALHTTHVAGRPAAMR